MSKIVQEKMNGRMGGAEIKRQALTIIRKLVTDKTAKFLLTKLFSIHKFGNIRIVQQYFSERIKQLGDSVKKITKKTEGQSPSYYYRRRENRAIRTLQNFLVTTGTYLKPPFSDSLITNIHDLPPLGTVSYWFPKSLQFSELARVIEEKGRPSQLTL